MSRILIMYYLISSIYQVIDQIPPIQNGDGLRKRTRTKNETSARSN